MILLFQVLKEFVGLDHFDEPLHQLPIDVHGVFIEAIVEIVGELFVLGLAVCGGAEVVLIEGVLEDVLGFDDIDRATPHFN